MIYVWLNPEELIAVGTNVIAPAQCVVLPVSAEWMSQLSPLDS